MRWGADVGGATAIRSLSEGASIVAGDAGYILGVEHTGHAFVARLDAQGTPVWTWVLAGSGVDMANGLALGMDGDIVVVGATEVADRAIERTDHPSTTALT